MGDLFAMMKVVLWSRSHTPNGWLNTAMEGSGTGGGTWSPRRPSEVAAHMRCSVPYFFIC